MYRLMQHLTKMNAIKIEYLVTLRIISALGENSNNGMNCLSIKESRYGELHCRNISSVYIKTFWFDEQQKCEYYISSTSLNGRLPVECHGFFTCITNHNRSKRYQNSIRRVHCKNCFPLHSGTITRIKCQASSAVNIDNMPYGNETCEAPMLSKNLHLSDKKICENSFKCSIENTKKTASIGVHCKVGNSIPGDDTTMESHVGIPVDDRSTTSHVGTPVDDENTEPHVGAPVDDRSTESHGGYSLPDDDTSFSDYTFVVGGIVGVLLVICIIVGIFLIRHNRTFFFVWKCNCRECRSAQKKSKERVMPTLNPTYDLTGRPNKEENNHQANVVEAPGGLLLSTSHTVYFDNKTDNNVYAKVNKLCHIQQPGIQTKKEEPITYPHPRTTVDDSDDMYDHIVHNAVHDICDGDYGIGRRRITDDDYDVSGNYCQSLSNNADPVYT